MGKVNCSFCGTAFSDTERKCPICGFSRKSESMQGNDDILLDDNVDFLNEEIPQRKNKAIFNYDEVNADDEENDEEDDEEEEYTEDEEDEETGSNAFLIVFLVIIITLLLLATGFLFVRFFLPNLMGTEETTQMTTEEITASSEDTTLATVPCKMLAMTSDAAKLNKEGQPWLLHVTVTPEDTTDELIFISENESVATVSEDGKIIAVGEGETIIKIVCGNQTIKCPVVVDYDMVIDEPAEDGVPTLGVEDSQNPSAPADAAQQTDATEAGDAATELQTEASTETTAPAEQVLKLKETDISLSKVRGITYELTLDCDIPVDQIEWITMNSNILLVKNGVITVLGPGTTKVVAKYNGQSVECIVRCVF